MSERIHLSVTGSSLKEHGRARGEALRAQLPAAYKNYAELFRASGISDADEAAAVEETIATLQSWRPEAMAELEHIARGSDLNVAHIVALNARTELLTLGKRGSKECSTVVGTIDGALRSVQTWDWHVELKDFWHTQDVSGVGYQYAGQTEVGVVAKVSMNEKGLGLHLNILGHEADAPGGVPLHVLIATIMRECASVDEALALIRETPLSSSSSFTLLDEHQAIAVEITPVGVFPMQPQDGFITRTNHFQHETPRFGQRSELYEPDSSDRLALIKDRLLERTPETSQELVALLESNETEAGLCARPDMSLGFGERWATLSTVQISPAARTISILDGMPTEVGQKEFRTFQL
ncbi:MAG: C45 family autoproteolytic acyltransferase/hydrolase [Canibacter sp.]